MKGHHPNTVALDARLFKRKITENGVSFTKKPHVKLSSRFLVCKASNDAFFEAAAQRCRARCAAEDAQKEEKDRRRRGMVANLVGAAAPRSAMVETLHDIGSAGTSVAPANLAASREQARCADAGMSALTSAWAGAVSSATGLPSGVTSDDATATALALVSSRQREAEAQAAARLARSARALEAPPGSSRLYVFFLSWRLFSRFVVMVFLFYWRPSVPFLVFHAIFVPWAERAGSTFILTRPCPLTCASVLCPWCLSFPWVRDARAADETTAGDGGGSGMAGSHRPAALSGPFPGPPRMTPAEVAASLTEWVFGDEEGAEREAFKVFVQQAAAEFGIRGSTLGGSADVDNLVANLFSRFSETDKSLASHRASCRDWIASLRKMR